MGVTDLRGRVAVVTGGGKGIGREIVRRLASEGARVAVWDIDVAAAGAVAEEANTEAVGIYADVTDDASVAEAVQMTEDEIGPVDILVNNAGVYVPGNLEEQHADQWRFTMDVNATAVITVTRAVLPRMQERNTGHVVNISSAAGLLGVPGMATYVASKWSVLGFTEAMRHEARNRGSAIRFSSVHPMYVTTGLFEGARLTGIGALIVPQVKSYDVVARAVVDKALRRGRLMVLRPRSLRLATLFRGILPYRLFLATTRLFGVHVSMQTHRPAAEERERSA